MGQRVELTLRDKIVRHPYAQDSNENIRLGVHT